jgi:uridine kinase
VDREFTPRDEKGEYDFEALGAMDLDFLGKQLNELLEGREVEIPRFDFKEGRRYFNGDMMQLHEKDILIMEGIHALNPAMIPGVDSSKVFRVYASALTSLSIDENNNISTSDNRMLRRMIRDNRTRGVIPEETIMRWQSVRRGENRNIFPFQENADAVFNSAHIFELPVLKYYAEPLLRRISPNSPAYTEASRMLKFLDYIVALSPEEIADKGCNNRKYNIGQFEHNHSNINEKLNDLKNIITKYLDERYSQPLCYELLKDIYSIEKDLRKHSLIENRLLIPLVEKLEKSHE